MVVDVCTLTLLIGIIAGVIFYLHGWGPTPGIRGLENRPGARGLALVLGAGLILFILDWRLYRTPNYAYFTSYLIGLAYGWLGLLVVGALLHILWGIGRRSGEIEPSRLERVSHLVLEALGLAVPNPAKATVDFVEEAAASGGGAPADGLARMRERLKREDPLAYLDLERLRLEGAQRELEQQRGNLERLWQEMARVRTHPEKAAEEVLARKQQVIAALQEELAKARRFYASSPERLQQALAEYDRLLAAQEKIRDEIQSLLLDVESGRATRDDLVRVITYQKLNQQGGGAVILGRIPVGEGEIIVREGDIASVATDVLVSSDNNYLTMSDGIARRIRDRGGEEIYRQTRGLIPLRRGDIAITSAGVLSAQKVFHAVVLDFDERQGPNEEVIRELVRNAMHKARELGYQRITFPVLGAGAGGFPAVAALRTMLEQLAEELARGENTVHEGILCLTGRLAEMVDANRALKEVEELGRND